MKKLNKMLAVALSLVLCLGMIAPAFAAAVAFDKNTHVGEGGELLAHENDDGSENSYDYYLDSDVELDQTLIIKDGANASIDLNGHELALNKDLKVDAANAAVEGADESTKQGSVIEVTGEDTSLTVTDTTGEGTISGGYAQPSHGAGFGGGIKVDGNASLDLQGGTITNNVASNGGGVYVGKGTATMSGDAMIDGNLATMAGGGVYLNTELASRTDDEAVFTMNGGTISNNTASGVDANGIIVGGGGGIGTNLYKESPDPDYEAIVINNGTITGNKAEVDGAGIYVNNGKVSITDSEISGNVAKNILGSGTVQHGGGIYASGNKTIVNVTNSTISGGNSATWGGGVYGQNNAKITLNGDTITGNNAGTGGGVFNSKGELVIGSTSKVYGNTATAHSDDVYSNGGKITLYVKNNEGAVLGEKERPVTGWYWDGSTRWGDKYTELVLPYAGTVYSGILCLKAAHDEYFSVLYTDGLGNNLWETEVENESAVPMFEGEIPARPGYNFVGWQVDGENFDPATGTVTGTLTLVARWEAIPAVDIPDGGDTGTDTEIDEPAVPLAAGPVTRAEFLDYLWRHEGEPESDGVCAFEDVPEDHPFILALAWAEQNGIAFANEDGTFQPDELVTVGAVREFLNNFAQAFGTNAVAAADLASLSGDDDEAVLNCDEVLAEFFGEEYAAPSENEAA